MSTIPPSLRTFLRGPWVAAIVLLALPTGCEEGAPGEPEPEPAPSGPAAAGPPEPAPVEPEPEDEAAGPVVAADSFELRATSGDSYSSGELARFGITLAGRGEWHVNQDYPFRIELDAPEPVRLPKGELEKDDAAEFGDERAHFDVPFTPEAEGQHRVEARVSFAMCTEETCVPEDRKVALVLPVQ